MEARRAAVGRGDWPGGDDPVWLAVVSTPGMRGEDKLAWGWLWARSRRGAELVETTAGEVAAAQGVTADAGRVRLRNLAASGLVHVRRHERATGLYLLEVLEPEEQAGRVVKGDPQRRLWDDSGLGEPHSEAVSCEPAGVLCLPAQQRSGGEIRARQGLLESGPCGESVDFGTEEPPEDPPEDPPEVPRCVDLRRPSIARAHSGLSTFKNLQDLQKRALCEGRESARRGSSGGSSAAAGAGVDEETAALAALIEMARAKAAPPAAETRRVPVGARQSVEQLPTAGADFDVSAAARAETLAAEVLRRIADPAMRSSAARKVAWAVVLGYLPDARLWQLLANVDKQRAGPGAVRTARGVPLSAYFNSAAKTLFARHGIEWDGKPR